MTDSLIQKALEQCGWPSFTHDSKLHEFLRVYDELRQGEISYNEAALIDKLMHYIGDNMENYETYPLEAARLSIEFLRPYLRTTEPERCKHGVWAVDHCYDCEGEHKPVMSEDKATQILEKEIATHIRPEYLGGWSYWSVALACVRALRNKEGV